MKVLPERLAQNLGEDFISDCDNINLSNFPSNEPAGSGDAGQRGAKFLVNYSRAERPEAIQCDRIGSGTPAWVASDLTRPISAELSTLLGEIPYPPLAIVCLSYDEGAVRSPINGFGFLAVPGEGLSILGCLFSSSLFPDRAPDDKALFTIFVG